MAMKTVVAMIACAMVPMVVQEEDVTRTFMVTGTGTDIDSEGFSGPLTLTFSLTFDAENSLIYDKDVDTFASSSSYSSFNSVPVRFSRRWTNFYVHTRELGWLDPVLPSFTLSFATDNDGVPIGTALVLYREENYGSAGSYRVLSNVRLVELAATAVPEPASWAMMIVGIGATGGGLRQRRRATVAFA